MADLPARPLLSALFACPPAFRPAKRDVADRPLHFRLHFVSADKLAGSLKFFERLPAAGTQAGRRAGGRSAVFLSGIAGSCWSGGTLTFFDLLI
jgi:hypothetical protein